jgi:hypothetical protein
MKYEYEFEFHDYEPKREEHITCTCPLCGYEIDITETCPLCGTEWGGDKTVEVECGCGLKITAHLKK